MINALKGFAIGASCMFAALAAFVIWIAWKVHND